MARTEPFFVNKGEGFCVRECFWGMWLDKTHTHTPPMQFLISIFFSLSVSHSLFSLFLCLSLSFWPHSFFSFCSFLFYFSLVYYLFTFKAHIVVNPKLAFIFFRNVKPVTAQAVSFSFLHEGHVLQLDIFFTWHIYIFVCVCVCICVLITISFDCLWICVSKVYADMLLKS